MNTQPTPTPETHAVYWINDPGHAWLAVDLDAFPEARNYGTGFGYKHGKWIYLEEDLEAPAFLEGYPQLAHASRAGQLAAKSYDFDAPCRWYNNNEPRLDTEAYFARRRAEREQVQA